MAARGKNAGRFKNMPAAQVRKLAEALGYESTPARSELLRRLAGRSDLEARLAGLVASLSRNARELFCAFAGKRVPADAVESGSGLSPEDAREALAELTEKLDGLTYGTLTRTRTYSDLSILLIGDKVVADPPAWRT